MLTRKQQELLMFIYQRLGQGGVSPSFDEMKDALGLKSKSGIHRLITGLEERGFIRRLPHRARALEVIRLPDGLGLPPLELGGAPPLPSPAPGPIGAAGSAIESPHPAVVAPSPAAEPPSPPPLAAGSPAAELGSVSRIRFRPNVIKGNFAGVLPGREVVTPSEAVALPLLGRIAAGTPIEALRDHNVTVDVPASLLTPGEHYALVVAGDSMIDAGILDGDTVIIGRCESAESGTIVVALIDEGEVTLKRLRRKGQTVALEPANPNYETRIFGADRVRVQGRLIGLIRRY